MSHLRSDSLPLKIVSAEHELSALINASAATYEQSKHLTMSSLYGMCLHANPFIKVIPDYLQDVQLNIPVLTKMYIERIYCLEI